MLRHGLMLGLFASLLGCQAASGPSYARRIESPSELIGGPGALGAVGDWIIGNQKVRVIIQDKGWSRGFGVFGGGVIDADLVRPQKGGAGLNPEGHDTFGEFFPALFLQAFDVSDQSEFDFETMEPVTLAGIEVINDGSDGEAAIIRTRAEGADFMTMAHTLLGFAVPDRDVMRFEIDYILEPGARHLKIVSRLSNLGNNSMDLSGDAIASFLDAEALQIPFGDIALFGAGNDIFVPGGVSMVGSGSEPRGIGFDLRYSLEASYAYQAEKELALPALTGLVAEFVATSGDGVSYGVATGDSDRNYVWLNRAQYGLDSQAHISKHSMLIPFLFSSFTGAYYEVPPLSLEPIKEDVPGSGVYEFTKYLIIGGGDVGSVRDELFRVRGTSTGRFLGQVLETNGAPVLGAEVHVFDAQKRPYSQVKTGEDGRFNTRLEPGDYYYVVTSEGRWPHPAKADRFSDATRFKVEAGDSGPYRVVRLPQGGALRVDVRDVDGQPLPAKVMVLGEYEVPEECRRCVTDCVAVCDPRNYLFEKSIHEHRLPSDLKWMERESGQFIVATLLSSSDGVAAGPVRPGTYDVVVSRGLEYDLSVTRGVVIEAGGRAQIQAVIERVVDTSHYVSADLHVHSGNSLDGSISLDDRVLSGAAEGLEIAVATDHNWITDYTPAIERNGLTNWIRGVVGVELSTLEMGHFNAFPLRHEVSATSRFPFVDYCFEPNSDKVNRSAFDWVECKPEQLFKQLRELGSAEVDREMNTLVQVNHGRDAVLGYFSQYFVNPYTGEAEEPTGDNYGFVAPLPEGLSLRADNADTHQFAVENFSFDFDLVEVVNGKRLSEIHSFRIPEVAPAEWVADKQDVCKSGHPNNGYGKVLIEKGGHISYPGVAEDWMNFLRAGKRFTATANSDSHGLSAEIGVPRNYVRVAPFSDGEARDRYPTEVSDLELMRSLREHRVLMTNGPFLDMNVISEVEGGGDNLVFPVGDLVRYRSDNIGRQVYVHLTLRTAPWVHVDRINLYSNGEIIDVIKVSAPDPASGEARDLSYKRTYVFDKDVFLIAEALGEESLFPVVTPEEDPPANIGDALDGVVGALGVADGFASGDGITGPGFREVVTPYALTNPIWLDIDASGEFDAPGTARGPGPAPEGQCDEPESDDAPGDGDLDSGPPESDERGAGDGGDAEARARQVRRLLDPHASAKGESPRWDIRKIFRAHQGHSH